MFSFNQYFITCSHPLFTSWAVKSAYKCKNWNNKFIFICLFLRKHVDLFTVFLGRLPTWKQKSPLNRSKRKRSTSYLKLVLVYLCKSLCNYHSKSSYLPEVTRYIIDFRTQLRHSYDRGLPVENSKLNQGTGDFN